MFGIWSCKFQYVLQIANHTREIIAQILAGDKSFGSGPSTVIPLSPTPGALELLPGHVSAPPVDSIRPRFTTETLQGIHGVTSGPALGSGQDLAPAQIEISVDVPAQVRHSLLERLTGHGLVGVPFTWGTGEARVLLSF
jgi:hypothetical protein